MSAASEFVYTIKAQYAGESDLQRLSAELKTIGNIKSFEKLSSDIEKTEQKLTAAEQKAAALKATMETSGTTADAAAYAKSAAEVDRTTAALEKQNAKLETNAVALKKAGVSVAELAAAQQSLSATAAGKGNIMAAESILGVRSFETIKSEIAGVEQAYLTLASSGTKSGAELERAHTAMVAKTKLLNEEMSLTAGVAAKEGSALSALSGNMAGVGSSIAGMIAAMAGFSVISKATQAAFSFNSTIEQSQIGIAALVRTFAQADSANKDYSTSMKVATGIQKDLQIAGLETTATYQELLKALQEGIGPAMKQGFNPQQIVEFTTLMTQAASALSMPANQLGQEMRAIMEGNIDQNARVAKALGLTSEKIKELAASGKLFDYLKEKLKEFGAAGEAMSRTLSGEWSNLADAAQMTLGKGLEGTYKQTTDLVRRIKAEIVSITSGTTDIKFNIGLANALSELDKLISDFIQHIGAGGLVSSMKTIVETITSVGSVLAEFAGYVKSAMAPFAPYIPLIAELVTKFLLFRGTLLLVGAAIALPVSQITALGAAFKGLWASIQGVSALSGTVAAFAAANPVLAGIAVSLAAAGIAWSVYGKSSLEASQAHAQAAQKLEVSKTEIDKQVSSLEALKQTLLSTEPGSASHLAAEIELAKVLPGVNISLDEQGNAFARVGNTVSENAVKLQKYIDDLKKMSSEDLGLQAEQLYLSQKKAQDALSESMGKIREFKTEALSVGDSTAPSISKWFLGGLLGDLSKAQKGVKDSSAATDEWAAKLAKTKMPVEDLRKALQGVKMSPEGVNQMVSSYKSALAEIEAAAGRIKAPDGIAKSFIPVTDDIKKQFQALGKDVLDIMKQMGDETLSFNASIREIGRSGMDAAHAWTDMRNEANEYVVASRKAASAGDFDKAKQLLKDAAQEYKQLSNEVDVNGEKMSGRAEKVKGLTEVHKQYQQVLQQEAETQKQAAQDLNSKTGGDLAKELPEVAKALGIALNDVKEKTKDLAEAMDPERLWQTSKQIDALRSIATEQLKLPEGAQEYRDKWNTAWDDFLNKGLGDIAQLEAKLNEMARDRNVTIHVNQSGSSSYEGYATGGDPFYGGLSGYGGGDRRLIMVEDGEHVIRKEAVSRLGHGFFQQFNRLAFPDPPALSLNIPSHIFGAFSEGGPVMAGGGGHTYQLTTHFHGNQTPMSQATARQNAKMILAELERMNRRSS